MLSIRRTERLIPIDNTPAAAVFMSSDRQNGTGRCVSYLYDTMIQDYENLCRVSGVEAGSLNPPGTVVHQFSRGSGGVYVPNPGDRLATSYAVGAFVYVLCPQKPTTVTGEVGLEIRHRSARATLRKLLMKYNLRCLRTTDTDLKGFF